MFAERRLPARTMSAEIAIVNFPRHEKQVDTAVSIAGIYFSDRIRPKRAT